jgi:hypothetical protein
MLLPDAGALAGIELLACIQDALVGSIATRINTRVKDLMSQSGIRFKDRGVHQLKGVPKRWRLYRVEH